MLFSLSVTVDSANRTGSFVRRVANPISWSVVTQHFVPARSTWSQALVLQVLYSINSPTSNHLYFPSKENMCLYILASPNIPLIFLIFCRFILHHTHLFRQFPFKSMKKPVSSHAPYLFPICKGRKGRNLPTPQMTSLWSNQGICHDFAPFSPFSRLYSTIYGSSPSKTPWYAITALFLAERVRFCDLWSCDKSRSHLTWSQGCACFG